MAWILNDKKGVETMNEYLVTLFGNHKGSKVNRDYTFVFVSNYKDARQVLRINNKNGNICQVKDNYKSKDDCIEQLREECAGLSYAIID